MDGRLGRSRPKGSEALLGLMTPKSFLRFALGSSPGFRFLCRFEGFIKMCRF
jgi:hypothetical protein